MIDDIMCSYKQAKVLQHLGFSPEFYCRCGGTVTIPRALRRDNKLVIVPTVNVAAKFLREEIGADLVVSPRFNSKTGDRIGYFWRWSQRTDVIDNKTYKTFEGALFAGISKVLEPFIEYNCK